MIFNMLYTLYYLNQDSFNAHNTAVKMQTMLKCRVRYLLLLLNYFLKIEACEGDDVKVVWKGNHNLQEKKTSEYDSENIRE